MAPIFHAFTVGRGWSSDSAFHGAVLLLFIVHTKETVAGVGFDGMPKVIYSIFCLVAR